MMARLAGGSLLTDETGTAPRRWTTITNYIKDDEVESRGRPAMRQACPGAFPVRER